jgi:hypothetical protein
MPKVIATQTFPANQRVFTYKFPCICGAAVSGEYSLPNIDPDGTDNWEGETGMDTDVVTCSRCKKDYRISVEVPIAGNGTFTAEAAK